MSVFMFLRYSVTAQIYRLNLNISPRYCCAKSEVIVSLSWEVLGGRCGHAGIHVTLNSRKLVHVT